ncbi:MAG: ABC transporter ATP-binding protein [Candidatus Adiutrix sp.]|jgi:lipoprotein-releasing system ATP-binding protein|nr:ABC transporter ATP-binding protein [Candidatus Adiutrix sp.]
MNRKAAAKPDPAPTRGGVILEASGLSRIFVSGTETLNILSGLDLTVTSGRSLAIVGASGSGKSTLLHLLGGLDRPTGGRVLYEGLDVFNQDEGQLAAWRNKAVGFVFQFHHLLADFTALENVAMPARLSGLEPRPAFELARPLLERVGLGSRLNHKPGEMSGGEQQRAALARALVMAPRVLLADEPTGNLDAKSSGTVNGLIMEMVREKNLAAVIVTHNSQLAALVDQPMELKSGRLVEVSL